MVGEVGWTRRQRANPRGAEAHRGLKALSSLKLLGAPHARPTRGRALMVSIRHVVAAPILTRN